MFAEVSLVAELPVLASRPRHIVLPLICDMKWSANKLRSQSSGAWYRILTFLKTEC